MHRCANFIHSSADDEVAASVLEEELAITGYSIQMASGSGLTSAYTNTRLNSSTATATATIASATPQVTTAAPVTATAHAISRTLSPDEMAEYEAFTRNQQARSSSRPVATTIDDTVYAAVPGPAPRFQTTYTPDLSKSSSGDPAISKSTAFDASVTRNYKDDGDNTGVNFSQDGGDLVSKPSAPTIISRETNYNLPDLPAPVITSHKDSTSGSSMDFNLPIPPTMKEDDLFDALQSRLAALRTDKGPDAED